MFLEKASLELPKKLFWDKIQMLCCDRTDVSEGLILIKQVH